MRICHLCFYYRQIVKFHKCKQNISSNYNLVNKNIENVYILSVIYNINIQYTYNMEYGNIIMIIYNNLKYNIYSLYFPVL